MGVKQVFICQSRWNGVIQHYLRRKVIKDTDDTDVRRSASFWRVIFVRGNTIEKDVQSLHERRFSGVISANKRCQVFECDSNLILVATEIAHTKFFEFHGLIGYLLFDLSIL